eukprot:351045-Chlamydomonas_euryale.AAC.2
MPTSMTSLWSEQWSSPTRAEWATLSRTASNRDLRLTQRSSKRCGAVTAHAMHACVCGTGSVRFFFNHVQVHETCV